MNWTDRSFTNKIKEWFEPSRTKNRTYLFILSNSIGCRAASLSNSFLIMSVWYINWRKNYFQNHINKLKTTKQIMDLTYLNTYTLLLPIIMDHPPFTNSSLESVLSRMWKSVQAHTHFICKGAPKEKLFLLFNHQVMSDSFVTSWTIALQSLLSM